MDTGILRHTPISLRVGVRALMLMTALIGMLMLFGVIPASAGHFTGTAATYTLDADFDEGSLVAVNHDAPNNNQLQLNGQGQPFNFIWVAASARGTIVKIDTVTGNVLGEYLSSPDGRGRDPSRTTVDANGNVWAGNRNEAGLIESVPHGSVVKVGLQENGQCVDRNGSGTIDTSSGLGDIRPWPDNTDGVGSTDGAAHGAKVQDAADECILVFQRTPGADAVRHVSVDLDNDVWVGGYPFALRKFHNLDENDGTILSSFDAATIGCGGYGGLVDGNNILWSASISEGNLLRYDIGAGTGSCISVSLSYGLGIDSNGFVWNSMWTNDSIVKVSPAGVIEAGFPKTTGGASSDRGVAVTPDDNVWVANSGGSDVSRLDNSGTVLGIITVGSNPTGVAVDPAGKIWAANLSSNTVSRIDPTIGLAGAVDLTVDLGAGAGPYNYSDMTGSITPAPPDNGTWTIIHDSGEAGAEWGTVSWNNEPTAGGGPHEPGDSSISVTAASGAGLDCSLAVFGAAQPVTDGDDLTVADGQCLKVVVSFTRSTTGETPILTDLTIETTGLGHYLSYGIKKVEPKFEKVDVALKDQFISGQFTVEKPDRLYTPADKNGEGIGDPDTHLMRYKVKPAKGVSGEKVKKVKIKNLLVTNQFGELVVEAHGPYEMLAPTTKAHSPDPAPELSKLGNVDHFLCYKVKPKEKIKLAVTIEDQFGLADYEVYQAKSLCNPVQKSHSGTTTQVKNPEKHLLCFDLKKAEKVDVTVNTNNQFGAETMVVYKARELCLPSTKTMTEPPEPMDEAKCKGIAQMVLQYNAAGPVDIEVKDFGTFEGMDDGDEIDLDAANIGKGKLSSNTEIEVGGKKTRIHTSCSKRIEEGEMHGDFEIVELDKILE